ncbi:MAG: hypothetical protein KKH83_07680 [Candidatus Margulisbacteria bacterium]|nr:hypothetical protein [Candidatus Margulisiibacteriota bacterium]
MNSEQKEDALLQEDKDKALWINRIRGIFTLLVLLIFVVSIFVSKLNYPLIPLTIIVGLALANVIITKALSKRVKLIRTTAGAYIRSTVDVILVAFVIHFTGGINSPFILLYIMELCVFAIYWPRWFAYAFAFQMSFFVAVISFTEAMGIIPHIVVREAGNPGYSFAIFMTFFLISITSVYGYSFMGDKLKRKQNEHIALLNEKVEFMNMLAHELRTPLTTIKEYGSIFLEGLAGSVNDPLKNTCRFVVKKAKEAVELTNTILDIARIESGIVKLSRKKTPLNIVIEKALREIKPMIAKKGIAVSIDLTPGLPEPMLDEKHFAQAFFQLLTNAANNSPDNSRITINAKAYGKNGGSLLIEIKDNGKGISKEDIKNIFKKFFSAVDEKTGIKGAGLGLSFCTTIIEDHGGKIWAESDGPGKGASIKIILPVEAGPKTLKSLEQTDKNVIIGEHEKQVLWINKIRGIITSGFIVIIIISVFVFNMDYPLVPLAVIGAIGLANQLLILLLTKTTPFFRTTWGAYIRSTLDTILVAFIIFFTGGMNSPFIMLYIMELSFFVIFYPKLFAYIMACQMSLLIAIIAFIESGGAFRTFAYNDPGFAFTMSATFFLIAMVVSYGLSQMADMIKQKRVQIDELTLEKSELMNIMEYKLREPVLEIKKSVTRSIEDPEEIPDETQKTHLLSLLRQCERILNTTSDLIDISKIEFGQIKINRQDINIGETIKNAVDSIKPQFDRKDISILVDVPADLLKISADKNKISQVLVNLLSNALKFSPEHSKIHITAKESNKNIIVKIKDEGMGIIKKDLKKVFDKFYSASEESVKVKGTGLGLALCKIIIEAHGGKIWANSEGAGNGATFVFTLPA